VQLASGLMEYASQVPWSLRSATKKWSLHTSAMRPPLPYFPSKACRHHFAVHHLPLESVSGHGLLTCRTRGGHSWSPHSSQQQDQPQRRKSPQVCGKLLQQERQGDTPQPPRAAWAVAVSSFRPIAAQLLMAQNRLNRLLQFPKSSYPCREMGNAPRDPWSGSTE
jgi:hypothetical protein